MQYNDVSTRCQSISNHTWGIIFLCAPAGPNGVLAVLNQPFGANLSSYSPRCRLKFRKFWSKPSPPLCGWKKNFFFLGGAPCGLRFALLGPLVAPCACLGPRGLRFAPLPLARGSWRCSWVFWVPRCEHCS